MRGSGIDTRTALPGRPINKPGKRFDLALGEHNIPERNRPFFRIWVRQHLDICESIGLCSNDTVSATIFLAVIERKVPEPWRREQAERAVRFFIKASRPKETGLPDHTYRLDGRLKRYCFLL